MKFLIDTECWLWWLLEPERLNPKALELISSRDHVIYFSAASSWEISIKCRLGKLILPEEPATYVPSRLHREGMVALPIEHSHALHVYSLPDHHRDPFDRLLIAQAQCESLPILTSDRLQEVPRQSPMGFSALEVNNLDSQFLAARRFA